MLRRGTGPALVVVATLAMSGSALAAPPDESNRSGAVAAKKPDVRWKPGVKAAKRYAERRGSISFAIRDLDDDGHVFRSSKRMMMASTFKTLVLVAYLRRNSVEDRNLTPAEKGLLSPMIRVSDNNATTQLRNTVGSAAINRLAKKAGMSTFSQNVRWGLSKVSAGDQARFASQIEELLPKRHKRYALRLLGSIVSSQRWGVGKERPTGWDLFFKGGWGTTFWLNHQVGFLKRNGCRVPFAIMTRGNPSPGYGMKTLRGIADRLFKKLGTKRLRRAC